MQYFNKYAANLIIISALKKDFNLIKHKLLSGEGFYFFTDKYSFTFLSCSPLAISQSLRAVFV